MARLKVFVSCILICWSSWPLADAYITNSILTTKASSPLVKVSRNRPKWSKGHYKGGRSSAKSSGRLYSRRNPRYSLSEAESTSGHMVLSEPRKKSPVTPTGIDPGTVRLVAQWLNHYATPSALGVCYTILSAKLGCCNDKACAVSDHV